MKLGILHFAEVNLTMPMRVSMKLGILHFAEVNLTMPDQVQANSGAIANNFDKDAVQSEIDLQVKVTQQFDTTRQQAKTIVNQQIDGLNKQVEKAKEALKQNPLDEKAAQQLVDANNAISQWETGGMLIDVVAGGLSGPSNTGLVGSLANAASPAIAQQIGQYFKDNKGLNELDGGNRSEEGSTAHILAQTILAAATAAAGGNDALLAGLSAGGAEAAMPMVANWLYGETDTSKLNAEQKQTISNIVGLGAAGFTASAGGTITDIAQSALSSQSAVENNILNAVDVSRYLQIALDSHANKGTDMRDRIQALVDKSAENDAMLKVIQKKLDNYRVNGVNTLTPEDYAYLERVEKNFGGKKGMEQTYYAVVQAAKIAVSQGKLTSDDYKNLVNQMYQFNMANPMIGQIDDILAEAAQIPRASSTYTPPVVGPLVVQPGYGNNITGANGVAGIDVPTSTKTITLTGNVTAIAGETGRTGGAGFYITLPGNRTNDNLDAGGLVTGGRGAGLDVGANIQLGATKGDKNALRGESTSIGAAVGPVGATVGLDKDNNINSAAVNLGIKPSPLPISGGVTNTTTCTSGISDWIKLEAGACK